MCAVSAIMDYGRTEVDPAQWTRPIFDEFKEVIRQLDALDKKLDQPECHDLAKARWMQEVEERLQRLEQT